MSRFLNRLLALPIAEQNQLFAALETRIESNIEQAVEAGSYEVGVETVRADSLSTAGRETLFEHPRTGAVTDLVEIVRRDRLEPTTAEIALDIGARDPGSDGKLNRRRGLTRDQWTALAAKSMRAETREPGDPAEH